jgi:hypothetical protein
MPRSVPVSARDNLVLQLQRTVGNQATQQILATAIQRKFSAVPGPETPNRNVLEQIAQSSAQLGYTFPVLNGERVHSTTEILGKLHAPEVQVTQKKNSTDMFKGKVTSVGSNVSSYELEYPDPKQAGGEQKLTRGQLADAVEGLRKVLRGHLDLITSEDMAALRDDASGAATLEVRADFGVLSKQTLEHERRHAADHEEVFTKILGGWDQLLEGALRFGVVRDVKAKSADDAEYELWSTAGGNPLDVAEKIWKELVRRSDAFHATPEGAEVKLNSVTWSKGAAHLIFELGAVKGSTGSGLTTPVPGLNNKSILEFMT